MPLPVYYQRSSKTSREAARLALGFATLQQERVLEAIRAAGTEGATRKELGQRLGLESGSVCPRVFALVRAGLVRETTARRGRSAVLVAVTR